MQGRHHAEGLLIPTRSEIAGKDAGVHARRKSRRTQSGGRSADVTEAVGVLEMARSTDSLFALTARAANVPARGRAKAWWKYDNSASSAPGTIATLPTAVRLALEMSLHEEDERRALEGELAELEDRWREAEEIAAIADDMFVPSSVSAALRRLKDGGR